MRILHIEDEPWDSGMAHYALTLAEALKHRGHEVHFWGKGDSIPLSQAAEKGLNVHSIDRPWSSLPSLRARLRAANIEIINAHTGASHSLGAALAAGSAAKLVRTRGDGRAPARHFLARALASRTSAFIAANSRIQTQLSQAFAATPVRLIFQGIEGPAAQALPKEPAFGLLGRLDPVKGHEVFFSAAATLIKDCPQARFLCAGGGRPERGQWLKERAGVLELNGHCEMLGFVPNIQEFMSRCQVGVVASIGSEAVSRAALEWMAAGRPVVATTVGGLPDIVADGSTGFLVPPNNPRALYAALKRFIDNPALAAAMGQFARRRYETLFSIERFARETEKLYAEI